MTERSKLNTENLTSKELCEARSFEIKKLLHSGNTDKLKNQIETEQSRTEAIRNYIILRTFVTHPEFTSESAQSYTRDQATKRSLLCLEYIKKGIEVVKSYEFKETQTQIESEEENSTDNSSEEENSTDNNSEEEEGDQDNTEKESSESINMAASSNLTVKVPDPNKYSSINSFYQAFKLYQKLQKLDENSTDTTLHYILAISTHPIWGDMAANLNTSEPDQKVADFHKKLAQQIEPSHVHSYNFLTQLQKLPMPTIVDMMGETTIDINMVTIKETPVEQRNGLFIETGTIIGKIVGKGEKIVNVI